MYCDEVHYMAYLPLRKNGVVSKMFGRLTQKGSSVVHSPYNIYYIQITDSLLAACLVCCHSILCSAYFL